MGQEADEDMATGANVRGAAVTVGRVPATSEQGRMNQALGRQKLRVAGISGDLKDLLKFSLGLWYQKGKPEEIVNIAGRIPIGVKRAEIMSGLEMDFEFRGPTRADNRELQAQQLMMIGRSFTNVLTPEELRALGKLTAEAAGVRQVNRIFTDAGTQQLKARMAAEQQAAAQQAQAIAQTQREGAKAGAKEARIQKDQKEIAAAAGRPDDVPAEGEEQDQEAAAE
jgi:hypothetical protein